MENNKCMEGCKCDSCSQMPSMMGKCGCNDRHCHKKMILKIVIFILIFWCGFKLGEITGFIRAQLEGGMMSDRVNMRMMMHGGYENEMQNGYGTPSMISKGMMEN